MNFEKTSAALARYFSNLQHSQSEVSYAGGTVGDDFILGPRKITVIGAPPGSGKTALVTQIAFEALDRNPELTLCIANAEMHIDELLKRELSRCSNVPHKAIGQGLTALDPQQHRAVCAAYEHLIPAIKRTRHMIPPFNCEELGRLSLIEPPGILIVDYLQKFKPAGNDTRAGVDAVVTSLRELAMQGWAILALSATTRSNSKRGGHDPESLGLSSFKESGEIEFNADAAYILRNTSDNHALVKEIDLDCVKNRAGAMSRVKLRFHGKTMRFDSRAPEPHAEFAQYSQGSGFVF